MRLSDLCSGEKALIESVDLSFSLAQRLIELGFSEGTVVSLELRGISRNLNAYRVKNTLLAIRNKTADKINVKLL